MLHHRETICNWCVGYLDTTFGGRLKIDMIDPGAKWASADAAFTTLVTRGRAAAVGGDRDDRWCVGRGHRPLPNASVSMAPFGTIVGADQVRPSLLDTIAVVPSARSPVPLAAISHATIGGWST